MGRPTDNPKDISLKVRLDKDTAEKLDEWCHTYITRPVLLLLT